MAPSSVDYPILIAQLPFVSKLATAELTHPAVRQELFGPMLREEQRKKAKEEVPEINAKEKSSTVTRDSARNAQQEAQAKSKQEDDADVDDDTDSGPSSGSPWTGNIINKKI